MGHQHTTTTTTTTTAAAGATTTTTDAGTTPDLNIIDRIQLKSLEGLQGVREAELWVIIALLRVEELVMYCRVPPSEHSRLPQLHINV
jgi:hypothetical protein